jgi:hypothetical protein
MAQYKQVRRNGRWIWVDKNGKEVKPGQGPLGEAGKKLKNLARQARDMVVYSDKPGPDGKPQTIDEERRRSKLVHGPGGSPSGSGQGQAQQTSGKTNATKSTSAKPKAKKPEGTKPASKPAASKPAASKPAASKTTPAKTTASKPASAPKSDKKRNSIAKTLEQLERMKRRSKKRQGKEPKKRQGKEPKMQGVGPYRSAKKYSAKMAGQPAKPAQAAKPNTKSKLRQAMEERMKKQRGRGY